MFGEGHGSGIHRIALELFWTFTSEQNFNIRHFDYMYSVAVLCVYKYVLCMYINMYWLTVCMCITDKDCQTIVKTSYIKVLFTGESPKQLHHYYYGYWGS